MGMPWPWASADRLGHLAAPRLAVGDQDERLGVRRLALQLLVFLEQPQAPVDAALDVRVPGCVVLEAERGRSRDGRGRRSRCSGRASGAPAAWRCGRTAPAPRGRLPTAATRRASAGTGPSGASDCRGRPDGAAPPTSVTCIDAEPSWSTTKSTPAVRTIELAVCGPRDRGNRERQCRAAGTTRTAARRGTGSARAPASAAGAGARRHRRAAATPAAATAAAARRERRAAAGTAAPRT